MEPSWERLARAVVAERCKGSFDCGGASLGKAQPPLRMTTFLKIPRQRAGR